MRVFFNNIILLALCCVVALLMSSCSSSEHRFNEPPRTPAATHEKEQVENSHFEYIKRLDRIELQHGAFRW